MTRDYYLRLLEQMTAALAGIVAKIKSGQLTEARQDLDALCLQNSGLDLARLKSAAPEALAERLQATGGLRTVRTVTLAEVLLQDANLTGTSESFPPGPGEVHAFCLLVDVLPMLGREDQQHYRVLAQKLADRLGPYRSHPYLQSRLEALAAIPLQPA